MNWADKARCRKCDMVRSPVPAPPAQRPQGPPAQAAPAAGRANGKPAMAAKSRARSKPGENQATPPGLAERRNGGKR
eukprot:1684758-Lingulodinium_polyedra.AAC.1